MSEGVNPYEGPAEPLEHPRPISMRIYLALNAQLETGCDIFTAMEAVASTAIEHPEWNLDEKKSWDEWEKENK